MEDSINTSATTSANTKSKRKTRGVAMLTNVTKAHESGVRYPIIFRLRTGKIYGEHADNFIGYMSLQCRSKINI